jgi:cytochrome P450
MTDYQKAVAPPMANLARLLRHFVVSAGDAAATAEKFAVTSPSLTNDVGLGPIRIRLTVDPDLARQLLVTEADDAHKLALEHHVLAPVMRDGLILLEGDAWARRRQAVASAFAGELMPVLLETTKRVTRARLPSWSGRVNVSHEARCLVYDLMLRFFAGGTPVGEGPDEQSADAYGRHFTRAERALERRIWDPLGLHERIKRMAGRTSDLGDEAEWRQPLRRRIAAGQQCPVGGPSALERLCAHLSSTDTVYHELTTEVAAGATSIHHLSWTCQLLATHPDVQERLFKEIDARREGAGSLPSSTERELADLESAPYLSAVIKESLRLYPPAPFLYRRGRDSYAVVVSIWGMHRHPRLWDQPNDFTPERWLGVNADPRAYMPFGLGPRTCIGRRFALIESRAALVEILRRFELKPAGPVPRPRLYIMTRPSRDIRLHVVPRDTVP